MTSQTKSNTVICDFEIIKGDVLTVRGGKYDDGTFATEIKISTYDHHPLSCRGITPEGAKIVARQAVWATQQGGEHVSVEIHPRHIL